MIHVGVDYTDPAVVANKEFISDEFTFDALGRVTLAIWGVNLMTLDIMVEASTYNDGNNDVWFPVRNVPAEMAENIYMDDGIKLRVRVSRFVDGDQAQTINISTGGGNT